MAHLKGGKQDLFKFRVQKLRLFFAGTTEKPGNSLHIYNLLYIANYSHIQNRGMAEFFFSQQTAEPAETSY